MPIVIFYNVDPADPLNLPQGVVGFGGDDEADESIEAGEGSAVYGVGEEDGAVGVGGLFQF